MAGQLCATNTDVCMGVDIHLIQFPAPGPPVPIPHPFIGMLFDFFDYVPILGGTVMINNTPRALAGTAAKALPSHIPIGGTFVKPIGNEGEQFMGSKTVKMDGEVVGHNSLPVISCQDIGTPAPFRANPKKKSKTTSLMLPMSIVLSIPLGVPVMIGGPPTISEFALLMKFGMAGLGKGLKKLANSKAMQKAMKKLKALRQKAFKKMKPGFLKCKVLRAEPVNIVTGEVVVEQEDFTLPWRIPFNWTRRYSSQSARIGVCGYGWETPADARLEVDEFGIVTFYDGTPGAAVFESLPEDEPIMEVVNGAILTKVDLGYEVATKEGLTYHFGALKYHTNEMQVNRIRDRYQNEIKYIRNEKGVLLEIQESSGIRILIRNSFDRIEEMILIHPIEDQPRLLMRYEYEGKHQLARVYDALLNPYNFTYAGKKMISHTDRNCLSFFYEYDGTSQDAKCIHAWGDHGLYDYKFQYLENETHFVDSLDGVWSVVHKNGLIVEEVDAIGRKTIFDYDESGRAISVLKIESGLEELFNYDDRGNLILHTRADGTSLTYRFNGASELLQSTDPNGNSWSQSWDDYHSVLETTTPRGGKWIYKHDAKGDLVQTTAPNGLVTHLVYNKYGNLIKTSHKLGFVEKYQLNGLGQVVSQTDQDGLQSFYNFDKKGRLEYAEMPDGNSVTYVYDQEDNIKYVKDGLGNETRLNYFGQGEIAEIIRSDGTRLQFEYDTEERLTTVINERNQRYTFNLDEVGRVIDEVDYWGHQQHFNYDAADNVIESMNADGSLIRASYDMLGRLLSKSDVEGNETQYKYDYNGNITFAKNKVATIQRKYDEENNLIEEVQNDVKVTNEFDLLGNRTKRKTSYGNEVSFDFDLIGRVNAIHLNNNHIAKMDYDNERSIIRELLSNTLKREVYFDSGGRIKQQTLLRGDNTLIERKYEYDKLGNLTRLSAHTGHSSAMQYDSRGRLKQVSDSSGYEETIEYNTYGYLLDEENLVSGDKIERYKGMIYQYNSRGNLTSRKGEEGEITFSWDIDNRLTEAVNEKRQTLRFGYDPLGRRVFKDVDGKKTHFAWDGDHLLHERTNERGPQEFIYRPETFVPFAVANQDIGYYETDTIGLPREVFSKEGQALWSLKVSPTGQREKIIVDGITNRIHFQGQYYDEELDLCYNRNRYYNTKTGRFISQDPLSITAGVDVYRYAPNIWKWIDPLGLSCFKYTKTAAKHFDDVVKKGEHKGLLARPYMKSPLTIKEIMSTGKGIPDASAKGALNFKVPGSFRGSDGVWELVVDPNKKLIYHFNFVK